jgi:hypothetical protein
MGLLGNLLGRGKPTPIPWAEALNAMAAAAPQLQGELDTLPTGRAALLVRPAQPPATAGAAAEVEAALAASPDAIGASPSAPGGDFRVQADADGHVWVVASAGKLEELAAALARAAGVLKAKGLEERILAAVFPFTWKETHLYWICRFKTGRYSPFAAVPGSEQLRDYPLELRMEAALRKNLPTERDLSQWYPIWGMPV